MGGQTFLPQAGVLMTSALQWNMLCSMIDLLVNERPHTMTGLMFWSVSLWVTCLVTRLAPLHTELQVSIMLGLFLQWSRWLQTLTIRGTRCRYMGLRAE